MANKRKRSSLATAQDDNGSTQFPARKSQKSTKDSYKEDKNKSVFRSIVRTRRAKHAEAEPAKAKVLGGIAELLEDVLGEVPAATIFKAMRVSRRWKSVIRGSIKLQQKMVPPLSAAPIKPNPNLSENKESFPIYSANFKVHSAIGLHRDRDDDGHNAVKKDDPKSFGAMKVDRQSEDEWSFFFNVGNFRSLINWVRGRQSAIWQAWRRLPVVEPPVVAMQLTHVNSFRTEREHEVFLYNPKGLTWGDLYRGTEEFETQYFAQYGEPPAPDTVVIGFRVKADGLDPQARHLLENCKGHVYGLCGCLCALQEKGR